MVLSITSMLKSDQIAGYSRFSNSSFANLFFKMERAWAPLNRLPARLGILPYTTTQQWHQRLNLALDAQWWCDIETIDSRSSNCRWGQGSDKWEWSWRLGRRWKTLHYTVWILRWNEFRIIYDDKPFNNSDNNILKITILIVKTINRLIFIYFHSH